MSTKPSLVERTDPTRTTSFDEKVEVDKPKEEAQKALSTMLGALEGMINTNVKTAKDNVSLTRSLTVLEDRFTKLEKQLDSQFTENLKWHQCVEETLLEQGRELDLIFNGLSGVSTQVNKLYDVLAKQLDTINVTFVTMAERLKIMLESRKKK